MSGELDSLVEPISAEQPCGTDLEYTPLLGTIDAFRLFGSDIPLPATIDWREVRDKTREALAQSHDLRLLAHLAAALVRIDGLITFCRVITVADRWLGEHWDPVFPRIDEDAILRRNALNSFADRMAIVDGVRRATVLSHRQLGAFSLRDLELATGQLVATEADAKAPSLEQIKASVGATAPEELQTLSAALQTAMTALRNIVTTMQTRRGFDSAPDFDPLLRTLSRIHKLLADYMPAAAANESAVASGAELDGSAAMVEGATIGGAVTDIKTRQDAIRALDAVATYFRSHEPSSPVPIFLERAKRLVSKSFMEVLEDIVPDSVVQAKLIGGIKNDEGQ